MPKELTKRKNHFEKILLTSFKKGKLSISIENYKKNSMLIDRKIRQRRITEYF